MLLILELQLPRELSVTYKKKKKSATFGGNYFFSTGAESAFERPKHSHKLIFDSVKLQPITTWKQYHKIYSFRHGMALIKSSVEFLNLTEACLFSFQILLSLHDHPFYTGQTTHMFDHFFILAALGLAGEVTGRSMQLRSLQLPVLST